MRAKLWGRGREGVEDGALGVVGWGGGVIGGGAGRCSGGAVIDLWVGEPEVLFWLGPY